MIPPQLQLTQQLSPERALLPDLSLSMLERTFPRTCACLREGEKERVAREFSSLSDPKDWDRLPAALSRRKWSDGRGYVVDLARLEIFLRKATLAPELAQSGFERVAGAVEEDWYQARFRFDPAHRLLESDWPLDEICARPQDFHLPRATDFLIYREGAKPQFRRLGRNEGQLLRSLSLGVPLGVVLERKDGPDFDAMTFHRWIESGLLRAIDWAPV